MHTSGSQRARGGCSAKTNDRITESTTKESREAKVKGKKAIQESKTENDKTKGHKQKRNKEWDTEDTK